MYPLAHLEIARAAARQGDVAKARAVYQSFFVLWKDADPDLPILGEAKAEYEKTQVGFLLKLRGLANPIEKVIPVSLLSVFLILLSFLQGSPPPATQTTANVRDVEKRFTAALLKKDAVALDELLADDLMHIGFEGQFAGKAEYVAFFKQDIWQYRKCEPSNESVKVVGNVAVVTGRVDRTIVIQQRCDDRGVCVHPRLDARRRSLAPYLVSGNRDT